MQMIYRSNRLTDLNFIGNFLVFWNILVSSTTSGYTTNPVHLETCQHNTNPDAPQTPPTSSHCPASLLSSESKLLEKTDLCRVVSVQHRRGILCCGSTTNCVVLWVHYNLGVTAGSQHHTILLYHRSKSSNVSVNIRQSLRYKLHITVTSHLSTPVSDSNSTAATCHTWK